MTLLVVLRSIRECKWWYMNFKNKNTRLWGGLSVGAGVGRRSVGECGRPCVVA